MNEDLYDEAMGPEPTWLHRAIDFFRTLRHAKSWRERSEKLDAHNQYLAAHLRASSERASRAYHEIERLRALLAPYGERILTGQAEDGEGAIRLPPLEYEMARSFMHINSRVTSGVEDIFLMNDFNNYLWRGRLVMRANPVQHPFRKN